MRTLRLILVLCGSVWAIAPDGIEKDFDVRIPMRDGVTLSANVFRPAGGLRLPAILVRTPYGKGPDVTPNWRAFVDHGYAVVVQDVRGRYASGGAFDPLRQESNDGEDTLSWIARRPWSNGRIGMVGGSYLGIAQWKAALLNHPNLKAIFPVVSGADDYADRFYSTGGALKLGQRLEWMSENVRAPETPKPDFRRFIFNLPLRTSDFAATGRVVDFYQQALNHPAYDSFWRALSTREKLDRVRIPVFAAGGWYDNFVESDFDAFRILRAKGRPAKLTVGPWPHNSAYRFPGVDFGPDARVPLRRLQFEWFDYWLRGPQPGRTPGSVLNPPLRIFVMGANRWRDEEEWPLQRAKITPFYLSSQGRANSLAGDGLLQPRRPPRTETADQFVYDPRDPVPTTGGAVCCNPNLLPWGPLDQRRVEGRKDVLVYSTPPLAEDVEVTGPIQVVLYVSTSQPDTDFTAKLVDVFPTGEARILTDGILRLRYRDSLAKAALARPGQVYPVDIDAGMTSNLFQRGHRIRVEISSSNFPRFDRNPNTGRPVADERELRCASQTVYHDRARPSRILLPVVR